MTQKELEEMKERRDKNITLEKIGDEPDITDEKYNEIQYLGACPLDWYPAPGIYNEKHKNFPNSPLIVIVLSRNEEEKEFYIEKKGETDWYDVYKM